jgi:hypothetical protein
MQDAVALLNESEHAALEPQITIGKELAAICLRKFEADLTSPDYYQRDRARDRIKEALALCRDFVERIWDVQDTERSREERATAGQVAPSED